MTTSRNAQDPPPHPFIVPPGMAYAAREANEAMRVRQEREKAIGEKAFDIGFDAGQKLPSETEPSDEDA